MPIDLVYRCIEVLYIRRFGNGNPETTPLYMAGYHKGLADGAVYLDKVPQFSDSDDASVFKKKVTENVDENVNVPPYDVFNPFAQNTEISVEDLLNKKLELMDENFVKVNKETDAENLDKN